jgi:hypothetical protein
MAEDLIGYRGLVEKAYETLAPTAFRLVVRDVLTRAAERGLPGAHHFFITFRTTDPGVALPGGLKARFPNDMTIVLQHQFWDLDVTEVGFSVVLKFGGLPQRLEVPYAAVSRFVDPSVNAVFLMEEPVAGTPEDETEYEAPVAPAPGTIAALNQPRSRTKSGNGAPAAAAPAPTADLPPAAAAADSDDDAPPAGTVVRLDAFRRK